MYKKILMALFLVAIAQAAFAGFAFNPAPEVEPPSVPLAEEVPQPSITQQDETDVTSEDVSREVPLVGMQDAIQCLRQTGVKGKVIPTSSKGTDVPISMALPVIVPGWKILQMPYDSPRVLLSWDEGALWTDILINACQQTGFVVEADWDERSLRLYRDPADREADMLAATLADQSEPPKQIWRVLAGSLKTQFSDFAKDHGYTLVWRPEYDVHLAVESEIYGSLADMLKIVLEGLQVEGTTLHADIYASNRIITISGD